MSSEKISKKMSRLVCPGTDQVEAEKKLLRERLEAFRCAASRFCVVLENHMPQHEVKNERD